MNLTCGSNIEEDDERGCANILLTLDTENPTFTPSQSYGGKVS